MLSLNRPNTLRPHSVCVFAVCAFAISANGADPEATIRTIAVGDVTSMSRNGQLLALTDWNTGRILLRDLRSGTTTHITKGVYPEYGMYARISPTGDEIAYSWRGSSQGQFELRVAKLDGSMTTTVLANKSTSYFAMDWSNDGREIIVWMKDSGPAKLASVAVAGRRVESIHVTSESQGDSARISPNGKFIAYDLPDGIHIHSVEHGSDVKSALLSADDRLLAWGPKGNWLLCSRKDGAANSLWAIPVNGSEAQDVGASPIQLVDDLGEDVGMALGMDDEGSLYYSVRDWENNLYVTDYSSSRARLGKAKRIAQKVNYSSGPSWSPDGKRLAYFRFPFTLVVHSVNGGHEMTFPVNRERYHAMMPSWIANGDAILVGARRGILKVNTETGLVDTVVPRVREVLEWPSACSRGVISFVRFRPDGGGRIVVKDTSLQNEASQHARIGDLLGRQWPRNERDVHTFKPYVVGQRLVSHTALSPDGARLAFLESRDEETQRTRLMVLDLEEEHPHCVFESDDGHVLCHPTWTPDNSHIVFGTQTRSDDSLRLEFWQVDTENWNPVRLSGLSLSGHILGGLSVHPDGESIAYTANRIVSDALGEGSEFRDEVRLVEDVTSWLDSQE